MRRAAWRETPIGRSACRLDGPSTRRPSGQPNRRPRLSLLLAAALAGMLAPGLSGASAHSAGAQSAPPAASAIAGASSGAGASAGAGAGGPAATAPAPVVEAAAAPLTGDQTTVDRIVAIVGDQVITLSDVRGARAFGLVGLSRVRSGGVGAAADGGPAGSSLTESQIIEFLIERELMRAEVERFGAGEPPAAQVDARVQAVQGRFASADAFRAALEAHGLSEARFRAWLADDARIEQYVEQRFGASALPTDEEVLQYYQSREREFAVGGRPRPFEEVREAVRDQLSGSRRQAMVDDWVSGLRRRTPVVMKSID